jgi:hypothetical protein
VCDSLPNGKLQLILVTDGTQHKGSDFDPSAASSFVVSILEAAKIAHKRSGKPLDSNTDTVHEWAMLSPSMIALGPCQLQNHTSLIVRFGEAQLGFPVPNSALRELGEALLTLSASDQKPQ